MRGRSLKWAAVLLAAGVGFAPLAHAFLYKTPDLTVSANPTFFIEYGEHSGAIRDCIRSTKIHVTVRNVSPVPVTRSFEVEVFLGRMRGGKLGYYTGGRHRRTVEGVAGNGQRRITITDFKITKALKGQGAYIVAVADSSGKITEQNETNNRSAFFLEDDILDKAQPCP